MGVESSWVAQQINRRLGHYAEAQQGLVMGPDCGYQIFPEDPNRIRFPDGSSIHGDRLLDNRPPRGHVRIVPALIIEVISPNDLAWEVEAKVAEYIRADVPLIWVFYPDTRTVWVYQSHSGATRLGIDDILSNEAMLPSFTCPVRDIFPEVL